MRYTRIEDFKGKELTLYLKEELSVTGVLSIIEKGYFILHQKKTIEGRGFDENIFVPKTSVIYWTDDVA